MRQRHPKVVFDSNCKNGGHQPQLAPATKTCCPAALAGDFANNTLDIIIERGEQLTIIESFSGWHFLNAVIIANSKSGYGKSKAIEQLSPANIPTNQNIYRAITFAPRQTSKNLQRLSAGGQIVNVPKLLRKFWVGLHSQLALVQTFNFISFGDPYSYSGLYDVPNNT